jgi:hypothetical protein
VLPTLPSLTLRSPPNRTYLPPYSPRALRAAHRTPQLTASGESIVSSLAPRVRSFARARCELDHFRKKEHARHGWESLPSLPASKGATCSSAHDDERRGTRAVPCRHPGVVDVRGGSDFSRFDPRPETGRGGGGGGVGGVGCAQPKCFSRVDLLKSVSCDCKWATLACFMPICACTRKSFDTNSSLVPPGDCRVPGDAHSIDLGK